MANAAGMACRVVCSATFIRRFFLEQSFFSPATHVGAKTEQDTKQQESVNLWRTVVTGALAHPAVLVAMTISSIVICASSPYHANSRQGGIGNTHGVTWDTRAAATHIVVGVACLGATTVTFAIFERKFLGELRALWSARRGGSNGKESATVGAPSYCADERSRSGLSLARVDITHDEQGRKAE